MKIHDFNEGFAEKYGVNDAAVFHYMCYCASFSRRGTFSRSLREFLKACPYLKMSQLRGILARICSNNPRPNKPVKCKRDATHTTTYKPDVSQDAGTKHHFDADIAAKLGILPAAIYNNLHFWIVANWKDATEEAANNLNPGDFDNDTDMLNYEACRLALPYAKFLITPEQWSSKHPYASLRSTERGFKALEDARYLEKDTDGRGRPWWRLPDQTLDQIRSNIPGQSNLAQKAMSSRTNIEDNQAGVPEINSHRQNQHSDRQNQHSHRQNQHSDRQNHIADVGGHTNNIHASLPESHSTDVNQEPSLKLNHLKQARLLKNSQIEDSAGSAVAEPCGHLVDTLSSPEAPSERINGRRENQGQKPVSVQATKAEQEDKTIPGCAPQGQVPEPEQKAKTISGSGAERQLLEPAVNLKRAGNLLQKVYDNREWLAELYFQEHRVRLNVEDHTDWSTLVEFYTLRRPRAKWKPRGANGAKRQLAEEPKAAGWDQSSGNGAEPPMPEEAGIAGTQLVNGAVDKHPPVAPKAVDEDEQKEEDFPAMQPTVPKPMTKAELMARQEARMKNRPWTPPLKEKPKAKRLSPAEVLAAARRKELGFDLSSLTEEKAKQLSNPTSKPKGAAPAEDEDEDTDQDQSDQPEQRRVDMAKLVERHLARANALRAESKLVARLSAEEKAKLIAELEQKAENDAPANDTQEPEPVAKLSPPPEFRQLPDEKVKALVTAYHAMHGRLLDPDKDWCELLAFQFNHEPVAAGAGKTNRGRTNGAVDDPDAPFDSIAPEEHEHEHEQHE